MAVSNLQLKQNGLIHQNEIEKRERDRSKTKAEKIYRDLEDVVQYIQHPKELKRRLIDIVHRHRRCPLANALDDVPIEHEFERSI